MSKGEVAKEAGGISANQAMAEYAQGREAAFEIVYEVVAPRIEGYVRRKVRDSSRVEDIVQQTFENMHRARGRFVPGSDVLNWAFAIARNLVIDTGKKAGRESSADMSEENESMGAVLAAAVAGGEELFLARETGALLVRDLRAAHQAATRGVRAGEAGGSVLPAGGRHPGNHRAERPDVRPPRVPQLARSGRRRPLARTTGGCCLSCYDFPDRRTPHAPLS